MLAQIIRLQYVFSGHGIFVCGQYECYCHCQSVRVTNQEQIYIARCFILCFIETSCNVFNCVPFYTQSLFECGFSSECLSGILPNLIMAISIGQFTLVYLLISEEKLLVKVDKLEFGRDNNSFMDFLIMGALRKLTPCVIQAYNLCIETSISDNERLIESCTPFLALLGQDPDVSTNS